MNNICCVPSYIQTTYSLCTRYLYNTLMCSVVSPAVLLLSFVFWLQLPALVPIFLLLWSVRLLPHLMYPSYHDIQVIFPFHRFFCFTFCFVTRIFYPSIFFYMLYITDQNFLNIDTLNTYNRDVGWGCGRILLCCVCQEFILCPHHRSINKIGDV